MKIKCLSLIHNKAIGHVGLNALNIYVEIKI